MAQLEYDTLRLRIFIPCWLVKWVYEQLAKHLNSNCTITIYVDLVLPGIGNQRHDKEYEKYKMNTRNLRIGNIL